MVNGILLVSHVNHSRIQIVLLKNLLSELLGHLLPLLLLLFSSETLVLFSFDSVGLKNSHLFLLLSFQSSLLECLELLFSLFLLFEKLLLLLLALFSFLFEPLLSELTFELKVFLKLLPLEFTVMCFNFLLVFHLPQHLLQLFLL